MDDLAKALRTESDRVAGEKAIREMAAELVRRGVEPEELGRLRRFKAWQGYIKNAEDEIETVDLYGFELSPAWDQDPKWPVVQQPPPVIVRPLKPSASRTDVRTVVVVPDPQIGYRRDSITGALEPLHDEPAIACHLQLIRAAQPDMIVNLGDTMDFAEWSTKFARESEFAFTTQPTLDRAHRFLADQAANAPEHCEKWKIRGNHDDRLGDFITKNALAALRLRQANKPESWPVLSLAHLLRLDELGVKLTGSFPAGKVKIADGARGKTPLYAMHGPSLDVRKLARESRQSIIQGHTHRISEHRETFELDGEPIDVVAISTGCLARRDGIVPSTRSGTDEHGRAVRNIENWQNAITLVYVQPDGYWTHEVVEIHNGRAWWRGKEYAA